jgi:ribosomal protein S18 acetylase RimI-like enzyme
MYATLVTTERELEQILELQRKNLRSNVSDEEKKDQGFVTMPFSIEMLRSMHAMAPSVIFKDDDNVVGYAIVFMKEGRHLYPDVEPMFKNFEKIKWNGKGLNDYNYYLIGQICVDKAYRGQGVVEKLYQKHKEIHSNKFECVITEISTSNQRSLKAHHRIGFKTISVYTDTLDEWNVVLWDWSTNDQ